MKRIASLLTGFLVCAAAACAPVQPSLPTQSPPPAPTATQTAPNPIFLDSIELLTLESAPPQFTLSLRGRLSTPCHQLKIEVQPPDAQNQIMVSVSSFSKAEICAQMIQPFEQNLALGSFPAGHYTVWVNGKLAAEFDA
ncbi:MAG: hypothetical protein Fur002_06960 [Anaerolineales bacterium]